MAGLRLHIPQGGAVVQRQGDVCAPQVMGGQVANAGTHTAEAEQAHDGLCAHRLIGHELGIAPGCHGRKDTDAGPILRLPQSIQGEHGRIGDIGDPPLVGLAVSHGHGMGIQIDIVPA